MRRLLALLIVPALLISSLGVPLSAAALGAKHAERACARMCARMGHCPMKKSAMAHDADHHCMGNPAHECVLSSPCDPDGPAATVVLTVHPAVLGQSFAAPQPDPRAEAITLAAAAHPLDLPSSAWQPPRR